jgi:aspartate-semialdehyde dehydrogenase
MRDVRVGVVGATGAVGPVALELLAERGFRNVRAFASARSAGSSVRFGGEGLVVEEATPETLAAGDLDVCFFSVGTATSRKLVPHAVRGGAFCVDKSSAFRLADGIPLVVPEVNGDRALEHEGIVANPNCSTIQLVCALKPLHDAAGLVRVRLATYQAVSGAGAAQMEELRAQEPAAGNVHMEDWEFEGDDSDEESKLRAETRKILELPELPFSATCVRVPVLVGHSQAVWVETEEPLSAAQASELLAAAPSVRVADRPTPRDAAGGDEVLVGRIREDPAGPNGLALFVVADNLRKGAALNAIQIAELLLERRPIAA